MSWCIPTLIPKGVQSVAKLQLFSASLQPRLTAPAGGSLHGFGFSLVDCLEMTSGSSGGLEPNPDADLVYPVLLTRPHAATTEEKIKINLKPAPCQGSNLDRAPPLCEIRRGADPRIVGAAANQVIQKSLAADPSASCSAVAPSS